jgi:hypothetical protein
MRTIHRNVAGDSVNRPYRHGISEKNVSALELHYVAPNATGKVR